MVPSGSSVNVASYSSVLLSKEGDVICFPQGTDNHVGIEMTPNGTAVTGVVKCFGR